MSSCGYTEHRNVTRHRQSPRPAPSSEGLPFWVRGTRQHGHPSAQWPALTGTAVDSPVPPTTEDHGPAAEPPASGEPPNDRCHRQGPDCKNSPIRPRVQQHQGLTWGLSRESNDPRHGHRACLSEAERSPRGGFPSEAHWTTRPCCFPLSRDSPPESTCPAPATSPPRPGHRARHSSHTWTAFKGDQRDQAGHRAHAEG